MKEKIVKPLMLQMIGLAITQCVMLTYNPLAVGWFGAMTTMGGMAAAALPVMVVGINYSMGVMSAAKYGFLMMAILLCSILYKRRNKKVTMEFASILSGGSMLLMELADWSMGVEAEKMFGAQISYENYYVLFMIVMLSVVAGSGTSIFAMAAGGYMAGSMGGIPEDNYITRQINQAIQNNNQSMVRLANGFKNLSYRLMDLPKAVYEEGVDLNSEKMTLQVAGCVCNGCVNCGVCWGNRADNSRRYVSEMVDIAFRDGQITRERLPSELAKQCINQRELVMGVNHLFERARLNFLWRARLEESRMAVALQLGEMAGLVEDYAKPNYQPVKVDVGMEMYIKQQLRENKIIAKKISVIENARGIMQVEMVAGVKGKKYVPIGVAERIISRCIGNRVKAVERDKWKGERPRCITNNCKTIKFVEDSNFKVLYGVSKKTKNNENISGDNYTIMDIGQGQSFISICDGMGSGETANKYSEVVVDLLETMLKSGFAEDTSLKLINSVLMLGNQWDSPLAVDIGLVDLYSGNCNLVKMGASGSYIKRGNWVECLKSTSLPMGAVSVPDTETITKKLYDGDFVIMVSDGVIEAIDAEDKEAAMGRLLMEIDTVNPQKMSEEILKKVSDNCDEGIKDDMTVVVMGIWDKI